jgi:hypothetical protein
MPSHSPTFSLFEGFDAARQLYESDLPELFETAGLQTARIIAMGPVCLAASL